MMIWLERTRLQDKKEGSCANGLKTNVFKILFLSVV